MSLRRALELYQTVWMFESHAQQRLAWRDAVEARLARQRAERLAAAQIRAMLAAHPSGALGDAKLDDRAALKRSGLL